MELAIEVELVEEEEEVEMQDLISLGRRMSYDDSLCRNLLSVMLTIFS